MEMDAGARNWTITTARNNKWRVPDWMGIDDLVQDGYVHWARLLARYPEVVERKHLMALYKTTYTRYLHGLSVQKTLNPEVRLLDVDQWAINEAQALEYRTDPEPFQNPTLVTHAPEPIRGFFSLTPEQLRRPYRRRVTGRRETYNEKLCRHVGVKCDLLGQLRQYLAS